MIIKIRPIELIQFTQARRMSERNHWDLEKGKSIKETLALDENEVELLDFLRHKKVATIGATRVMFQKLVIKEALYTGINTGKYLSEIDFVVPLEDEVKAWARSFGYALSPKPNTIWITGADGWQYEAIDSPPPSKTEFSLLW